MFGDRLVTVTYSKLDGPPVAVVDSIAGVGCSRSEPQLVGDLHRPEEARHGSASGGAGCPAGAVDLLTDLVAIYDEGRRTPLPLPPKTSFAWAEAKHGHGDPERSAGFKWRSNDRYPGEDAEKANVRALGQGAAWLYQA